MHGRVKLRRPHGGRRSFDVPQSESHTNRLQLVLWRRVLVHLSLEYLLNYSCIEDAPQVQQPPCKRCNMHRRGAQIREGEGRTTSLHSVWAHTRTTQAYAKGCEAYTAYPRPSTGPRKDRAPLFYQSPHRSPHTSQVQLRCNAATVTASRLASCHPRGTRPPETPLTKYGCDRAVRLARSRPAGRYSTVTPPPPRRRILPPPHTPPPPPPPPLLPLRTFSRQTRGLPERKTWYHPPSPQR